jgi:hypothetical protein
MIHCQSRFGRWWAWYHFINKVLKLNMSRLLSGGLFVLLLLLGTTLAATAEQRLRKVQQNVTASTSASVGRITGLVWINADTDQPTSVMGLESIPPGAPVMNQSYIPSHGLNLGARGGDGPVGSVVFTWNGRRIVENFAPYAMCANTGRNYFACNSTILNRGSTNNITARAYSGRDGTGIASDTIVSTSLRYRVRRPEQPLSSDPVTYLHIVDATTDTIIANTLNSNAWDGFCRPLS